MERWHALITLVAARRERAKGRALDSLAVARSHDGLLPSCGCTVDPYGDEKCREACGPDDVGVDFWGVAGPMCAKHRARFGHWTDFEAAAAEAAKFTEAT